MNNIHDVMNLIQERIRLLRPDEEVNRTYQPKGKFSKLTLSIILKVIIDFTKLDAEFSEATIPGLLDKDQLEMLAIFVKNNTKNIYRYDPVPAHLNPIFNFEKYKLELIILTVEYLDCLGIGLILPVNRIIESSKVDEMDVRQKKSAKNLDLDF